MFVDRIYDTHTHIAHTHSTHTICVCAVCVCVCVCVWRCGPIRARASTFLTLLNHTKRRTTVGRTPEEWSARRRGLYLTTHNTHNRQISMSAAGFEPTISASGPPQTYNLHRTNTVICTCVCTYMHTHVCVCARMCVCACVRGRERENTILIDLRKLKLTEFTWVKTESSGFFLRKC
jgi:hypothetical protein